MKGDDYEILSVQERFWNQPGLSLGYKIKFLSDHQKSQEATLSDDLIY